MTAPADALVELHDDHQLTITPGPFGRRYVECSCGFTRVVASSYAANRVALIHHHEAVGGCNCPEQVRALDSHPSPPQIPGQASPDPVAAADQA